MGRRPFSQPVEFFAMTYQLLEKLSALPLPYEMTGNDVDLARAYVAAGFVIADFVASDVRKDIVQKARIFKVTPSGRRALLRSKGFR